MGFTYDSYITEEDFETVSDTNAGNVLMKALLLTDEQVERYGQRMQNLTDDEKITSAMRIMCRTVRPGGKAL